MYELWNFKKMASLFIYKEYIRATPIAEAMLALVIMEHALRHRAQCGDVRSSLPSIAASAATPQSHG